MPEIEDKKVYKNAWLTDLNYIKSVGFQDSYYLESLCYHIGSFVKNTPIPVVTELSVKEWKIYFSVGHIRRGFKINVNYNYFDYVTLVKNWLYKYYPQYTVEYGVEVSLSDKEILDKVKFDGMDLNDAIHLTKTEVVKEHAVIEKIVLKEDQFILNKNGKRYLYLSGTIKNPQTISAFKKQFLSLSDDKEKKKFIDENSTLIREFDESREITIEYQGQQMLNFFRVNFKELIMHEEVNIAPVIWKFGKFVVKFSSQSLMDDCLKYYKDRKERTNEL